MFKRTKDNPFLYNTLRGLCFRASNESESNDGGGTPALALDDRALNVIEG